MHNNEGLTEKEWRVLEVVLPGREVHDLPWGRKGLPGGPVVGETIQVSYIMIFIQDGFQLFSLHFKSAFH